MNSKILLTRVMFWTILISFQPFHLVYGEFVIQPIVVDNDTATNNAVFEMNEGSQGVIFPIYWKITRPLNPTLAWGIQMYSDNKNSSYTGVTLTTQDGLYGGVFLTNLHRKRIPLYWHVYSQVQQPGAGRILPEMANWAAVQDRSDNNLSDRWQDPSVIAARTLVSFRGGGTANSVAGGEVSNPVYLYVTGDFSAAQDGEEYQGSLCFDYVHALVDSSLTAGYAKPNPFQPALGQKTEINFFGNDSNALITIRILNLKGKLIKTLQQTRFWDGTDDNGQLMEGGIYLYQAASEGKRANGTVVLIK